MSQYGYALIGLTALIGIIAGFLAFAVLRVGAGVRDANKQLKSGAGAETAFLAAALQEAVGKLKAQGVAISPDNLRIAENVTLILPLLDASPPVGLRSAPFRDEIGRAHV